MISFTLYVPAVAYEWLGLVDVDVCPSPKLHALLVPVEVLVKAKLLPLKQSDVSTLVKAATGCGLTYTVFVILSLQLYADDVISFTLYVPADAYE